MHVVTFYSFKGGVGRTMALMNTAIELVQRGRKVLVVDFDLEAPGVSSFDIAAETTESLGLVDYVCEYLRSRKAPDASAYLHPCKTWKNAKGELWVMPSGKQDSQYGARLTSINWEELYSVHDGYLMFEDLKAQWRAAIQPDYVLIDSRTGHTDVGGICTRQLPDAVVLMMFPNRQNLRGMVRIHREIQAHDQERARPVERLFVLSNVPDLDDEAKILRRWMKDSQAEFGYQKPAAVIRHYDSMSLLDQVVFTKDRPRSRLAEEYRVLANAIIDSNVEDADGARATLTTIEKAINSGDYYGNTATQDLAEAKLTAIAAAHERDGEVLYKMGRIREQMAQPDAAIRLFESALEAGFKTADLHVARAGLFRRLGQTKRAVDELEVLLNLDSADYRQVNKSTNWLLDLKPEALEHLDTSRAFLSLPPDARIAVASSIMVSVTLAATAERALRSALTQSGIQFRETALQAMGFALLAQGRFSEAAAVYRAERDRASGTISNVFNYAMAEWALTGCPAIEDFRKVTTMHENAGIRSRYGANYFECIAIAYHHAGKPEMALQALTRARQATGSNPKRETSAWRYLSVGPEEFTDDLNSIQAMVEGKAVVPMFMRQRNLPTMQ